MTPAPDPPIAAAPSIARLVKTTLVALAVAIALLVAFVLPAEYAIDPLRTGRRLGLTEIAAPKPPAAAAAAPAGAAMTPTQNGPIGDYPREFKVDVFDYVLEAYEFVEYKYQLEKNATMIYAWAADTDVQYDFHGERAADVTDAPPEQSFDKSMRREGNGVYTAPFKGVHGWYWENPGAEPIKIHLASAGFYTSAVEIHSNRTRYPHDLRPLVVPPAETGAGTTISTGPAAPDK